MLLRQHRLHELYNIKMLFTVRIKLLDFPTSSALLRYDYYGIRYSLLQTILYENTVNYCSNKKKENAIQILKISTAIAIFIHNGILSY